MMSEVLAEWLKSVLLTCTKAERWGHTIAIKILGTVISSRHVNVALNSPSILGAFQPHRLYAYGTLIRCP